MCCETYDIIRRQLASIFCDYLQIIHNKMLLWIVTYTKEGDSFRKLRTTSEWSSVKIMSMQYKVPSVVLYTKQLQKCMWKPFSSYMKFCWVQMTCYRNCDFSKVSCQILIAVTISHHKHYRDICCILYIWFYIDYLSQNCIGSLSSLKQIFPDISS